ncbi:MAG TPA: potassium/proton antiporter [Candidatus Alistipes excrementipullorum]|nr:potassium/proton antiporter [Candidatus Alistipes excrementipullorum]
MVGSENFLLVGAVLLIIAVLAGKVAYRFGAPALLLFLGVGMLFGYNFISFNSAELTQFIGMIALCIILFSGGMDTKFSEIRPVIAPGVLLATLGVMVTALIVGAFVYFISPLLGLSISFPLALLLASTMASTDSASVFSILRTKKQGLRENLRPLLELESGSNDPMAYIMTILLVGVLSEGKAEVSVGASIALFFVQMIVGALLGYAFGRGTVWIINKINIGNPALYSVLLLAAVFLTFSFTSLVEGNGYLAVYIAGLVVGNHKLVHKRTLTTFFDSFTWLFQIIMFLTLGLLVNLKDLFDYHVLILGCLIGCFMILVARPVAVMLCLAPFRKFSMRARLYVSWVGLRGAVPIIFATYPIVAHIEGSDMLFDIVFCVTIISLLVQGTTVSGMANLLGLAYEERESSFGDAMQDRMKSAFTEVEVNDIMLEGGNKLSDIVLPDNTLVVMVCRDGDYFVPRGNAELMAGDKLLVLSDRNEELQTQYKEFGIDEVMNF